MVANNFLLSSMSGSPLFIAPNTEALFKNSLTSANELMKSALLSDGSSDFWAPENARLRPYNVTKGILNIPVRGVLNNSGYQVFEYLTGYGYIWEAFSRGMTDRSVKAIALTCNSPGGVSSGMFDLVDKMRSFSGTKPIHVYGNGMVCSACYAIASVADKISVTKDTRVGSIGVIMSHVDISAMLERVGVNVEYIQYGKYKAMGNPENPLSDEEKGILQASVDKIGNQFVNLVSTLRNISFDDVKATEAAVYSGDDAVSIGLVDTIHNSFDDVTAVFAASISPERIIMSEKNSDATVAAVVDEKQIRAEAFAEGKKAGIEEGRKAGIEEGASNERARLKAIIESPNAADKSKTALKMALNPAFASVPVDAISDMLADLPSEKAGGHAYRGNNAFADAMNKAQHPELDAGPTEVSAKDRIEAMAVQAVKQAGLWGGDE